MVMPVMQYAPETCAWCEGRASMGNMGISAWYAMGRVVCWWHNHPTNARIAQERGHRCLGNF